MAALEVRHWSAADIRAFIMEEVICGATMNTLNAAISLGAMNAAIHEVTTSAHASFEAQAMQVVAQQETISGVLNDCRAFVVAQTRIETTEAKRAMNVLTETNVIVFPWLADNHCIFAKIHFDVPREA